MTDTHASLIIGLLTEISGRLERLTHVVSEAAERCETAQHVDVAALAQVAKEVSDLPYRLTR